MIDDKKIEEEATNYAQDGYNNYDNNILRIIEEAFKSGAKWMQEEFLKDLWHQTNKEPEGYDEWILLHYSVGNYYSLAQVKEFKSWKGFVEKRPIDGWLYIDDLFSKEGGNQ